MKNIEIDMVFAYCNGNDPKYRAKKEYYFNKENPQKNYNPSIRNNDIEEIFYAVRSVIKYIPWIRKIFIVTDDQIPPIDLFLINNKKVIIIDHKKIIDKKYLPTFNSTVIESFLHNIPGLSEIFLYNNDDVFHMSPVKREDIYEVDNKKIILKLRSRFKNHMYTTKDSEHAKRINLTCKLFFNKIPKLNLVYNHHTKVLRKSTLKLIENQEKDLLDNMRKNKFRGDNFIHYLFFAINLDCLLNENIILNDYKDVLEIHYGNTAYLPCAFDIIKQKRPKFLCMNSMPSSYKIPFEEFMKKNL